MKYRRILAAITAAVIMGSAYSCGRDEYTPAVTDENTVSESATGASSEEKTEKGTTKDKDEKKTTTAADSKQEKSTTTAKSGDKKENTTTVASGGGSDAVTTAANNNNNNSGESNPTEEGSSADNGGGEESEEKVYTAEIILGASPSIKGSNVSANGPIVTINGGGDFLFTGGVTDGQICVNTATEEKVTIVLNGVDISNSNGPAIFINEAKKCTIKSREGTVNHLSDGGKDKVNNGVIFSNDTVRLKGNGELNITANNAHGIASDDDIIIDNGTYNISSKKSGIFAHDDITVNEGRLNIKGGTNGIKSKGTININGGYTVVSGGTKEDKSSVYSEKSFNYTGGYVYAAGNKVSSPAYSETPYIILDLGETAAAGSSVEMLLNGQSMISFEPHNDFRCLLMLAPEESIGSSFRANVNGNGKDFTISDSGNIFKMN